MKKTNVYLPEQQKDALQKMADRSGRTVAELIRQAVDEFLARQKETSKGTQ